MSQFKSWFQKAFTSLIDPDRESRIATLVKVIHRGMQVQGQQFSLSQSLGNLQFSPQDLVEAKQRVYRGALERGWGDGLLSAGEQRTLKWLAGRLELQHDESRNLELSQARKRFGLALAQAMEDGILDEAEEALLRKIAAAVGCRSSDFAREFYRNEGEAFLRSIFLACVADDHISQQDWNYLLHASEQFGLTQAELLDVLQPQARSFVEHVLADAKSDGRISATEQQTLAWLLDHLKLPIDFRGYVSAEIQLLLILADVEDGRLPSVSMPAGMERRSGEIIHWAGPVVWREHRVRRGELHAIDHDGLLAMTDNRLVFAGGQKSQAAKYRRIVAHRGTTSWMEVQLEGKPASLYLFRAANPIPYSIFRAAVQMANQTKLAKLDGAVPRHIPREVRQRVWQKYGGRCAECSATTYLEFDHIIPIARGGSNTDANVQLLCRTCNLKKSDHI
jgi:tellurite resistance protein